MTTVENLLQGLYTTPQAERASTLSALLPEVKTAYAKEGCHVFIANGYKYNESHHKVGNPVEDYHDLKNVGCGFLWHDSDGRPYEDFLTYEEILDLLIKVKPVRYSLFDGRHDLPDNEGAICDGFNFETFSPVYTAKKTGMMNKFSDGKKIELLVTGLTPALTAILSEFVSKKDAFSGEVYLLHFDKNANKYVKQQFL